MKNEQTIGQMSPRELLTAIREAERENFRENWEDKLTPMPITQFFSASKQTGTISVCSPINFLPEALSVAPECAPYFLINALFIGQEPQTASTQYPLACSLLTTREPMRFSSLCVGQSVILQLTYLPPKKTVSVETWVPPKGRKKGHTVTTLREVEQEMLFSACVWGRFQRKLFDRNYDGT